MFLSEIFDTLTYGELAQLSLGSPEYGKVTPANYPKLITNINSGLIELYKRFSLSTKDVNIDLYEHINAYTLNTEFLESNAESTQPYKYLSDSSFKPFTNDILLIEAVFNEAGDEYPINESEEEYSVFTPAYNVIQVPFAQTGNTISATYRAAPEKIPTIIDDPATTQVPLPDTFLECIVAYVVSKIHASGPAGENNQAGMYWNKFVTACELIKTEGLVQTDNALNRKLDTAGWV